MVQDPHSRGGSPSLTAGGHTQRRTPRVKVCQICSSLSGGGLARVILNLGPSLAEQVDLSIIATAFPGYHWPSTKGPWTRRVVLCERTRFGRYHALYRLLRDWRPDVVHCHQEAYAPIVAKWAG